METIQLGIIGAGRHSMRRVFPTISQIEGAALAAVCDLDPTRATEAARRFGAQQVYQDYRQMLASAHLDGVIVCIGPEAHSQIASEALRAGLHVYTEKPPALSSQAAYAVWQTSRETGRICMTGFKKRYAPVFCQAYNIIHSPGFGEPTMLSIWRSAGYFEHNPDNPNTWFLLDMGIHTIDLARYLFGEVTEVCAWSKDLNTYAIHLAFVNHAIGVISLCAKQTWGNCSERVDITSETRQFIRVENGTELRHYADDRIASLYQPNYSFSGGDSLHETGFVPEMNAFVEAIRSGCQPISNIESGYYTMLVYEAIRDSAQQGGRTLTIPHEK